jgi:putative salt-induced outer membrane protein YdiY
MKTSYLVKYDNEPVPGLTKTDSILSVALVANF